ncbi:Tryptophan-associated transmembrane protein [Frankia canadensis]|uniref:Tryptophan-associated transmembrane protein n=1 Tax=Frankia canadensis TaxID=1836972 RepID=A0A2I2KRE2_9ACTN|nr:Trp biosynthesis-associated membrane protein [Frankia canadensis]SNQ48234.1 Tryptophan-associated transmembrane protein [Frankia canadensis]SOU55524.1 Tryptophan-associated transmembrane protein [Frankia canadensis]
MTPDGRPPTSPTGTRHADPAGRPPTSADRQGSQADRQGRRERGLAVLGCLLGSGLVLACGGATWVSARIGAPHSGQDGSAVAAPLAVHWTGNRLASAATALALLGLAAVVAIVATRRIGRTVVGLLAAAAGIGVVYVTARIGLDPLPALRRTDEVRPFAVGGQASITDIHRTAGPWLAMLGGVLLTAAGALAAARGRRWPVMSGRYQARDARPVDAWDAIERGHDPT